MRDGELSAKFHKFEWSLGRTLLAGCIPLSPVTNEDFIQTPFNHHRPEITILVQYPGAETTSPPILVPGSHLSAVVFLVQGIGGHAREMPIEVTFGCRSGKIMQVPCRPVTLGELKKHMIM